LGSEYTKNAFTVELNPGHKRVFGVLSAGERVWWLQMSFYCVKRNLQIETHLVVYECTVYYRV